MTQLIISEKPAAAAKLASALGDFKQVSTGKTYYFDGEIEGKKTYIAPAVGHLFTLSSKEKKYPNFDLEWTPMWEKKGNAYAKQYAENIKKLAKLAKEFIVATDYDVEGEVIGYNCLRFLCNQNDAKRMKFSTLTSQELQDAYKDASQHIDFGQAEAGITRHNLDWMYGMNLSTAVSSSIRAAANRFITLSVGRVQGPALSILAKREREIKKFEAKPYWLILANLNLKGATFVAVHKQGQIWNNVSAKRIFDTVKDKQAKLESIKSEEQTFSAPVPFDLTTLQTESWRCFKITPKRTLQIAQNLYTSALISYPRTSSQKLPPSIGYRKILQKLANQAAYTELANLVIGRSPRQGEKTDPAHPCFSGDSELLLDNHSKMQIAELEKNVSSWTFDPSKLSYCGAVLTDLKVMAYDTTTKKLTTAKITKLWKTPTNFNKILKLTLENSASVNVTPNHLFYTTTNDGFGFAAASELTENTYVGYAAKESAEEKIILTERDFINTYAETQQERIRQWFYGERQRLKPAEAHTIDKLCKLGLLPLKANSQAMEKLAALLGFICGDGHINYHKAAPGRLNYPICCFTGSKEDMEQIRTDIKSLGIDAERKLVKSKVAKNFYSLWIKHAILSRILIALGAPCGNKVASSFSIPEWILNGNKSIKKAFLAAYFGCEMSIPRTHFKNKRDIKTPSVSIDKTEENLQSGIAFYEQIQHLLKEDFLVDTSKINVLRRKLRKKYKKETYYISFTINNSRDNLIRFFSRVGYAYCTYKKTAMRRALAYLLYRNHLIIERLEKKAEAIQLRKQKLSYSKISKLISVPATTINGWINYRKSSKENHTSMHLPVFEDFGLMSGEESWQKIIKIEKIAAPQYVYDIEVKGIHTFFVNGFLVHNCVYPTGEMPKGLEHQEMAVYDLVVKRFLATFGDPSVRETTSCEFDIASEAFGLSATKTITQGWMKLYWPYSKQKEEELPRIRAGEVFEQKTELQDNKTKPPARYTPASIIKELERKDLGTKATRSDVIDKLYHREYVADTSIRVTPLGLKVVDTFEHYAPAIVSEELTREFELEMEKIREGAQKKDKVLEKAEKVIIDICKDLDKNKKEIGVELASAFKETEKAANTLMKCPKCGKGEMVVRISKKSHKRFMACNAYPDCSNTWPLPQKGLLKITSANCKDCGTPMIVIINKGRRPWRLCIRPDCKSKSRLVENVL